MTLWGLEALCQTMNEQRCSVRSETLVHVHMWCSLYTIMMSLTSMVIIVFLRIKCYALYFWGFELRFKTLFKCLCADNCINTLVTDIDHHHIHVALSLFVWQSMDDIIAYLFSLLWQMPYKKIPVRCKGQTIDLVRVVSEIIFNVWSYPESIKIRT